MSESVEPTVTKPALQPTTAPQSTHVDDAAQQTTSSAMHHTTSSAILQSTSSASSAAVPTPSSTIETNQRYLKYETVTGFFQQDEPDTNATTFDFTASNFGLINRNYSTDPHADPDRRLTQWQRFGAYVDSLNKRSEKGTMHKVLYLGRHGEGFHNVAEAFYGTELWDCYWSKQPGNQTVNWTDARLTPLGVAQIEAAHRFWQTALADAKTPAPEHYYVSPLLRCLATAEISFQPLKLPDDRRYEPEVKELLREVIGVHTCDKRSSRSVIEANYPYVTFEDGFRDEDPYWEAELREPTSATEARLRELLDDVFANSGKTWLSLTSHSGAITAMLAVLGHRPFALKTGGVIPVLVKASWVDGRRPPTSIAPGVPPPTCSATPVPTRSS